MDELKKFYFYFYEIKAKALDLLLLTKYKGSSFRGAFGHCLRKLCCVTKINDCFTCNLKFNCLYSLVMESPINETHPYHRKYRKTPHPYLIIPPLNLKTYFKPEEKFTFQLILIGSISNYLPYFLYTLLEIGKNGIGKDRGKFDTLSISSLDIQGNSTLIYDKENQNLNKIGFKIDFPAIEKSFEKQLKKDHIRELTLSFLTPLRIIHKGKLLKELPFKIFLERLLERALLLSHFYCDSELPDFQTLFYDSINVNILKSSLIWFDWQRYSFRQKRKMKFGGLLGNITYRGNLNKYLPLIKLGEYIHIGKAVTFGLGKYKILNINPL